MSHDPPLITVIIPTLDEEEHITRAVKSACGSSSTVECIVVDGGSNDRTRELAASAGATVIRGPRGRGPQMNTGAARAKGEILLFLHADARLPRGFDSEVREIIEGKGAILGAFSLDIAPSAPSLRLISLVANLRARHLGLPYGDQCLFLEKKVFSRLNGFSPLPIMEDFDLARRAKREGRVLVSDMKVRASARRWQRLGAFKTTLLNQLLVAGFCCGVPAETLSRLYKR